MSDIGKAEQWYAQLESIIRRYRAGLVARTETTLTLDEALQATRALHLHDRARDCFRAAEGLTRAGASRQ